MAIGESGQRLTHLCQATSACRYEKMRGLTWQRCPNAGCAADAWKPDSHCNRMICKCGVNFCFLCGLDITQVRASICDGTPVCVSSLAPATSREGVTFRVLFGVAIEWARRRHA